MTPTLPIPIPLLAVLALTLTFPHPVQSHGYLSKIAIDGTPYTGPYVSGSDTQPSPQNSTIRQVADISPVKGASNPDLVCGLSASTAKLEASAKPGSTVEVWWDGGGGQNWPHEVGPVMAYLAACEGVDDCTTFDASGAQWFKVDQMGIEGDGSWYQAVFQKSGSLTLTLPSNLPSGHYLLRSEIIALHIATSVGGAEFYPACVQLNVQGGSGSLNPSPTVKFPGAYADKDPGIYVPDVYDPGFVYTFPGGPVSNFAATADSSGDPPAGLSANSSAASAGSGSGSGSSSGSGPGSSSPAAPTSPAGTSVTGNKRICKLAKPDAAALRRRKRELGHGLGVGKSWGFGGFW